MKGFKGLFLLLFFTAASLFGQQNQPGLSLVTVYPGNAIYSAFGHTAFRYVDPENNRDILYNFGTFDFRDPNFVPKFVQGQLDYFLGVVNFKREFKNYTLIENRGVVEQKLNLTPEEIAEIYGFLTENALPENRYYKYDFIKDNCSSRIKTVFDSVLGDKICYDQGAIAQIGEKTYRQYIRSHLRKNPWFDFGIQLVLGMPLDQKVLPSDSFFLPVLVYEIMENSTLSDGRPLVAGEEILFGSISDPINDLLNDPIKITPPFVLLSLLLAAELGLIYFSFRRKSRAAHRILRCYEYILVSIMFLLGLLIFYLWFISDHTATKGNLNILWCTPLSLVFLITFFMKGTALKVHRWASLLQAVMCIVFIFILLAGLQTGCSAFIPMLLLYTAVFGRRLSPNLS